jgi:hypothetical protein
MRALPTKGALLACSVLAMCAFALPSMAPAASWSPVGTTHVLTSPNLTFTIAGNSLAWSCTTSQFHADVVSASTLRITGAAFRNCSGLPTAMASSCTMTAVGTQFPWTVTAATTSNIEIEGVHIGTRFEGRPGTAGSCGLQALSFTATDTLTGNINGGGWDPDTRQMTFVNASGLTGHALAGLSFTSTVTGTLRDASGTLNLSD